MNESSAATNGEATYYYAGFGEAEGERGVWDFDLRWPEVEPRADLRPTDRVLDLGCAEGLISLEVAKRVAHVDGVELRPARVEAARRLAAERGVENVSFACGSVPELELEPRSYDVVLFLGVLHHLEREKRWPSWARVLQAARRQVVMRTPLLTGEKRSYRLLGLAESNGYIVTVYPRREQGVGHLIVADRSEDGPPPWSDAAEG